MTMARVEQAPASTGPVKSRWKSLPLGNLTRSLVGKLILLLVVFITVPIILYSEFRQADSEKRTLLLESVRAQGRLIAESLRPLLAREGASPLPELNAAIKPFANPHAGIKVLYRPAGEADLEKFFFVASEPPVSAATLKEERDRLMERGVLDKLSQSCEGQIPMALRHRPSGGKEELLTSITPVTTKSGCWAIITIHTATEMIGTAIDQPYWKTIEVRVAAAIYVGMALITIGIFLSILRGLTRFRVLAQRIGTGRAGEPGFSAQNNVPELSEVAQEFDRMTGALKDSAESIRVAAEDNAHAFKTPIAIMRQSLTPLLRLVPENSSRGRRALEVIEEAVDRLEHLVTSARRLDQATAELLEAPRERIDLSGLLERMLMAYGDVFTSHGLTLKSDIEAGIIVSAGEDMIETVIENVIDNGVGIAPKESEFTVQLRRDKEWAELAMHDRGPGVQPQDLERIFERYISLRGEAEYSEVETAHTANEEDQAIGAHVGIGLWIVRRNLQAIGGDVRAENRPGGGLSMILRMPLAVSKTKRGSPAVVTKGSARPSTL